MMRGEFRSWWDCIGIIMQRAKGLELRFDKLEARAMLARLYHADVTFIPGEVASLPDAKLAEWWEAHIARPNPVRRKAAPKRGLKR